MGFRSSLPAFQHLDFEHERSLRFAEYWHGLPKQDLIPSKRDFDPCTQGPALATYVIHELVSPEMIRIRLAGTRLRQGFVFVRTGRNYLDFVEEKRRASASRAIFLVGEHPAGMLVRLAIRTQNGTLLLNETLALPMRDNDGVARLVYYQANDQPGSPLRDPQADPLVEFTVRNRVFIDIGNGLPAFEAGH